jgi:hypothetical protein
MSLKTHASLAFKMLQALTISAIFQQINPNNTTVDASRLTKDKVH